MKATIKRIFGRTFLSLAIAGLTLAAHGQATNTTWVGTAGDNEWTNGLNWDDGFPPDNATGTNGAIIPNGFPTINYDQPMVAAAFGGLTNGGVLNIETNGFNCAAIVLTVPPATSKQIWMTNSGAVVNVSGPFTMGSNTVASLGAGASLTVASLAISASESSAANNSSLFTNSGGTIIANSTTVNNNTGTGTGLLMINGGTNFLGNTAVGRYHGTTASTLGTEGLAITGGQVTMTNLNLGNNGAGASFLTGFMSNGTVTNYGSLFINNITAGRFSRFVQSGGFFIMPDPGVVNPNSTTAGAVTSVYMVTGGTNIIGGFYFGNSNTLVAATANFTNSASVYIGSAGISSNGAAVVNIVLNNNALIGATADWTGSVSMNVNGAVTTIRAADPSGVAHNITQNNPLTGGGTLFKTGGGTLTLNAVNTYSGSTLINGGTLALGATATLNSPLIVIGAGNTFDVSAIGGTYTMGGTQTLSGSGTVNGLVTASAGTINPGSNALTGTLTFASGLTESGNVVNHFDLSANPSGPNNDLVIVTGDFTASGANTVVIGGTVTSGGVYPIIQYSGNFNGTVGSFTLSGATGILSNNATTKTIYFVAQAAIRGPTKTTWVGNAVNNRWDSEVATNWNNAGALDFFVPGDTNRFDNSGGANTNVNIVGSVAPAFVTVDSTLNYFFGGNGSIDGSGSLIKTNSGTLTILSTNGYNGATIISGGVISVPTISIGGVVSPIGAASSDPSTLILDSGTLRYTGAAANTDRGVTLTNAGGTIEITGGAALTENGSLVGPGGLTVADGTLIVTGSGNNYAGQTTVTGGNLQLNNPNGASTNTITLNNGALTYSPSAGITVGNPFNFTGNTNMIVVTSGSSANPISSGNWSGSGVLMISNTFSPYTVNGTLDGFTGTILLVTPTAGGQFRFNSGGGNTSFGSSNALFDLGTGTGQLVSRNPGTMNVGGLQGVAGTVLKGPTGTAGTVVWSIGNNNLNTTFGGAIQDNAGNELSSILKVGNGTLTLTGNSTYTGPTTVNSGTLEIDGANTGTGQLTVSGTLQGGGSVNVPVVIEPGATLVPGIGGVGQFTVNNNLSLNSGCTNFFLVNAVTGTNTAVAGMTGTGYGGVLIVSNTAGTFVAGQKFILFAGSPNTFSGAFDSMILPTLPSPLSWDTSGLLVDGSITVHAPLSFTSVFRQSGNLIMNGIGGVDSGFFSLLSSSNLTVPLSNWTVVNSYFFNPDGSFNVTNPVTPGVPRQFYLIQEQVGP